MEKAVFILGCLWLATVRATTPQVPFYNDVYPGVPPEELGAAIYEGMKDAFRTVVAERNPDPTDVFNALLVTAVDPAVLSPPEVVAFVAQALGTFEVARNPIPALNPDNQVLEGDGTPVNYHFITHDTWSRTLGSSTEIKTYYPLTRAGVINIVKMARRQNARVRVTGLKHSWNHMLWGVDNVEEDVENPCYRPSDNGGDVDYIIAMVPYEISDQLYLWRGDISGWRNKSQELSFVQGPLETWVEEDGKEWASVKVGAAALSIFFQEWGLENGWTLPTEANPRIFTMAGVVTTQSHGSGIANLGTADYVIAVEYVDEKGEIQVVDDPDGLDAVAGSLGLFGVILSLTFRVTRMTYTTFAPQLLPLPLEQPFPKSADGPLPASTVDILENYDYSTWEVFDELGNPPGFPRINQIAWKADPNLSKEDANTLLTAEENFIANAAFTLLISMNNAFYDVLLETGTENDLYFYHSIFGTQLPLLLASFGIGPIAATNTTAIEAMHYLRGTHVSKIWNFEINVPVRDDGNGNPDWGTAQDVFWIGEDILQSYREYGLYPSDIQVEFRTVGGSTRLWSSTYGNKHGSISINFSRTQAVPQWLWDQFKNDLAFRFQYFNTGPGMGKPRHHLGKQVPVGVSGMNSAEYLLDTYGEQIDLFMDSFERIVTSRGSSVSKTLRRFSTKFLDLLLTSCRFQRVCRNIRLGGELRSLLATAYGWKTNA